MKVAARNVAEPSLKIKAQSLRSHLYAHGLTGDGTTAAREKGEKILAKISPQIISAIKEFGHLEL